MPGKLAKLEKAHRQNPDVPFFARLADFYLSQSKIHKALSLCEKGCERFPDYIAGFTVLSKCYEAQGELEEARKAVAKALRLDPENPGGLRPNRGRQRCRGRGFSGAASAKPDVVDRT